MTVKMSSEGDTSKNLSTEVNEKSGTDQTDSSQDSHDAEDLKSTKPTENSTESVDTETKDEDEPKEENADSEEKSDNAEAKIDDDEKVENDVDKKEKKEAKENDAKEEETENSEKTEEEDEDEASDKETKDVKDKKSKDVPLLDQPLEKTGKRERKNVQRFNEPAVEKETKFEMPSGSGTPLGEIPRVDASISRFKNDDLKTLHKILFKVTGKTTLIKKNIKKFSGFEFDKDSEEYGKKLSQLQKLDVKYLKVTCEILDLAKTGVKEELCERILHFLLEPADSGKGGGRPKRTAAVKANNRGYSSHDGNSSDELPARARRDKGKRTSLKDATSSESDEEFQPSDGSEEKPRVNKRKRVSRKKVKSEEDEQSDEADQSAASSDESDGENKGKRKKPVKANNKTKVQKTPAKRGRKPAAATSAKKTPSRSAKKKVESSEEEQSDKEKDDAGSSSEDEPLAKKAKGSNPPTDDEIKTYIKEILEGANLEEITMKNVCQKVYAHYPDFDLSHKKDFIKSTVKSVIEFIGKENVNLSSKQIDELIDLLDKEEILEVENRIEKALLKDKSAFDSKKSDGPEDKSQKSNEKVKASDSTSAASDSTSPKSPTNLKDDPSTKTKPILPPSPFSS